MNLQQIISNSFENMLNKEFSSSKVKKAVQAMADDSIAIMRERTMKGIDANGKRFAKFSKSYLKRKPYLIRKGAKVNEFAAKGMPSHIRLSGALFGAMKNQLIQYAQFSENKINSSYRLYIDASQDKKVQGLLSDTGVVRTKKGKKTYKKAVRDFFGIKSDLEKSRLIQTFIKAMDYQVSGSRNNMKIK